MKRDFVYYKGTTSYPDAPDNGEIILGFIIGKDEEYILIETINNTGISSPRIKDDWTHPTKKCPRLKRKGKYIWIYEGWASDIVYIGKQIR